MAYQALARKWRPQDFSSLVGQDAVVRALRNALVEGRLAQAYLFAGIRGVGKTSAARILAKALNCERGPAADPCNECAPCREITAGADLDVLEVDAATYSKVEQVRELTESLRYGPARDRYKVVVLDEVHRLSRQAFDALLKIVEEPPPHLVFVFATTEIEAVPATVLSRCQEYSFRRVPARAVVEHLRVICRDESIDASDSALHLVARAGEGSVRDAVALLDQLATFGNGSVSDDEARRLVGTFDLDLYHRLLGAVVAGNGRTISDELAELESLGADPRQLYSGFLGYVRDALHLALGADRAGRDLPAEAARDLEQLGRSAGYENLLRLLHGLLASENLVRRSEASDLALEIALLRAAELPRLTAVEHLLRTGSPGSGTPPVAAGGGAGRGSTPGARRSGAAGNPEPGRPSADRPPAKDPGATHAPAAGASGGDRGTIPSFLRAVRRRRQMLAAHLNEARGLSFAADVLTIVRPPSDPWLTQALQRSGNRRTLEDALEETFGPGVTWRLVDGEETPASTDDEPAALSSGPAGDPAGVQSVLEIFEGTVRPAHENEGSA
jgi:DNA polymerase-3 subunit gamma/tau